MSNKRRLSGSCLNSLKRSLLISQSTTQSNNMKVYYNSRSQHVDIDAEDSLTISKLKTLIQDKTGVSPLHQEIYNGGKKLSNAQTLGHYHLTNADVLELHMHMNGGCSEWCSCCGCSEGCSCTIL